MKHMIFHLRSICCEVGYTSRLNTFDPDSHVYDGLRAFVLPNDRLVL